MTDVYVVVEIATTCDESSNYVSRDSTELIELTWAAIDATTLETIHLDSILVRPTNTPITPYCAKLHKISWEHVKSSGGTFKGAILKFDKFVQLEILDKDLQFLFVTWDVSKLRVQLPREARDKLVVLPSYLQHPRVFDLQNEYVKWQATHPEALSYTSSSIGNIITALEIELEADEAEIVSPQNSVHGALNQSQSQSQSSSQSSSSGSPSPPPEGDTRSKTMSLIYSKFLTQLIKKSIPVEDHPLVLTKPFDSAQDVKVFLAERSKILYLSNLPLDTTQSELESWFTQYGGRPIAFWTLKMLDEKNSNSNVNAATVKSINGFAVFATHEEATESLSMNGRLLNDKSIEVQASSTRVLDKASDLLTPFPPLKNRPRPGDWTCPSCGFSNFQRRTACFRCSFPASSAVAIQESIYTKKGSGSSGNGNNNNNNNNNSNSNNSNNNYISNNNSNHSSNDKLNPISSSTVMGYSSNSPYDHGNNNNNNFNSILMNNSGSMTSVNGNNHNNYNNSNNNNNNNNNRSYGNNVPFRAGDWKCETCFYHNFAKNLCCLKCGNGKPANSGNNNNNNNNNNGNNNSNNGNNIHLNSVNSTAAAIAAATASGQPLNLTNGFVGPQQTQQNHYGKNNNNQGNNLKNSGGKQYNVQLQQYQKQMMNGNKGNIRGNHNSTPKPLLQQHLMMLQQQQQQQQKIPNHMGSPQTSAYSHPVGAHSQGMYEVYGNQYGNGSESGLSNIPKSNHGDNRNRIDGLSNHIQSLNLNN